MKKMKANLIKKVLTGIIAVTLIFSGSVPAFANETSEKNTDVPTLAVKKISEDEEILTLAIELEKNPGLSTLELELKYDSDAFLLTDVNGQQAFFSDSEEGSFTQSESLTDNPQYCMWRKHEGSTANNGMLVNFTFQKKNVQSSESYTFEIQNVVGGYLDESQTPAQTVYRQFDIIGYTYKTDREEETKTVLAKYDEDADDYYFSATETVYASAGRYGYYYYLGTKSGDSFTEANSKQLESCTMTVKKDGIEQGKTVISVADGITQNDAVTGIDYGISYEEDEETNEVLRIYPELSFHLSSEATKDYQAVCGTYTIEASWIENGENYTATTEIIVIPGKVLSEILSMTKDEDGVIDYMYANDTEASQGLTVQYSPFKSYMETQWNEETDTEEQVEVTESYIYTDSDVSGIFDFIGVEGSSDDVDSAAADVFATGEKLLFDNETQVVPLVVHRKNITSDMNGKTFSLKFRNGERIATVTAKIENEDANISLGENKLYAFYASGGVVNEIDVAGNIKLNSNADLQEAIQTHIEISADEGSRYVFAVYQDGKLQAVKLKIENENKPMQIEADGDYEYLLYGRQPGECVLHAADDASLSILCRVGLPEYGIYASRERSENAYLDSEFHFINAKQKKSDNSEAYFYVMMPKYNSNSINLQNDLNISFAWHNKDKDNWVLRNEDGIYFTQDGIYTDEDNGKEYYVWKVTVQEKYADNQKWKYIRVYGGLSQDEESGETYYEYSGNICLHIYDAQEIDEEHQLYWVDNYRCNVNADGRLEPKDSETEVTGYELGGTWSYGDKNTGGYIAIRKTEEGKTVYYAMKQLSIPDALKDGIKCADETGFLYDIEFNVLGSYQIFAMYEGEQYKANIITKRPNIGFYKTASNSVEEGNLLENELAFSALEKNTDETEAYFYVITGEPISSSKIKTIDWYEEGDTWHQRDITVEGLSFEDLGELEDGCHIWKAVLDRAAFKTSDFWICVDDDGSRIWIADASTKTKEQQIYWIDKNEVSSISEADGLLEAESKSLFTTDIIDINLRGNVTGYFAIFNQGSYYAVNPTTLPKGISRDAISAYLYEINVDLSQKYEVAYDDGEQERSGSFQLQYFGLEAFSSLQPTKAANLQVEAKFKELAKDENGNAYFYVLIHEIGKTQKLVFCEWVPDEEGNETIKKNVSVEGLSISDTYETLQYGEQNCLAWKVTIDKDNFNPQNGYIAQGFFTEAEEGGSWNAAIEIYSNAYVEPPKQMYWIDYDEHLQLNSDGIISVKNDSQEDEEEVRIEWLLRSSIKRQSYGYAAGSLQGYFAILKNGQYQVVDIAETLPAWINRISEKPYLYEIGTPTEALKTQISCEIDGERYAIDYRYSLPHIGLSSDKDNLWETYKYPEELWLEDLPKDEEGNRYIYVYELENQYSYEEADLIPEGRVYYNDAGDRIDVTGIKLQKVGFSIPEYAGEKYFIFKALISEDFEGDEERKLEFECPAERYVTSVQIHDRYSVKEEEQLYIVPRYTVESVAADGKLVIENEGAVRKKAEMTVKVGMQEFYFAVKKNGAYYAVTPDEGLTRDEVKAVQDTTVNQYYYDSLILEKSGKYWIRFNDEGKEYRLNLTAKLPAIGFYSSPQRTDDTYIAGGELHFNDAAEGNEDEKYFYLIAEAANGEDDVQLCLRGEDKPLDIKGVNVTYEGIITNSKDKKYHVWKLGIGRDFRGRDYTGVASDFSFQITNKDFSQRYDSIYTRIFDSREVPEEQQLYFFYPHDCIEVQNGKLKIKEGRTEILTNYAMQYFNPQYGQSSIGYLAVYKSGEFNVISETQSTGSVYCAYDTILKMNRMYVEETGDYEIKALFNGNEYYLRGYASLPSCGFYKSVERSTDTFIKDYTYERANTNNHFYFIVSKANLRNADLEDISVVVYSSKYSEAEQKWVTTPANGITLGDTGTLSDEEEEYYFWEFKISKDYEDKGRLTFQTYVDGDTWMSTDLSVYRNLILGDIDENSKIDFADALYFKRYLANWTNYEEINLKVGDTDGNGELTPADLMILERHIAGWAGYEELPKVR